MSPPGIEPATFWFLAGHLDRLAIEAVDYLCCKLVQYREKQVMRGAYPNTLQYNKKIDYGYICIVTEFQTKSALYMLFITVYI